MDREETKKIIRIICASYPNYKPADISETIDVWANMLSEYSYEHIAVALKTYIATDTSGFAPSIGELIQKANSLLENGKLNEIEAWTLVSKALRNGYYGAEEEFAKLPPIVQKAVGSPEQIRLWARTDDKSIETVISSNFMRTYKAEVKRAEEYARLPEDVKALMQKMSPLNRIESKGE
jgi:hypothetical protein